MPMFCQSVLNEDRNTVLNPVLAPLLNFLQHTSLSPDGKLAAIVGDNPDGLVIDPNSGKVSGTRCTVTDFI